MSRAEYKEISPIALDEVPRVASEKVFEMQSGLIKYINSQQKVKNTKATKELLVQNFECFREGHNLVKITQISIDNILLRIKDEFQLIQESHENKIGVPILKRRNNYTDPKNHKKSDTRNLIKNLINLYSNWLHYNKKEKYEEAYKKTKAMINKIKYFNKLLIQQLCQEKIICETFVEFAEGEGEDFIENSRIQDKECHLKALENYSKKFRQCFQKLCKNAPNSTSTNE